MEMPNNHKMTQNTSNDQKTMPNDPKQAQKNQKQTPNDHRQAQHEQRLTQNPSKIRWQMRKNRLKINKKKNWNKDRPIPCPYSHNLFMTLTFLDLAMEVDGIHRRSDNVCVAVPSWHNASDLVHQLHGDTCFRHANTHTDTVWRKTDITACQRRKLNKCFITMSFVIDHTRSITFRRHR